MSEDKPGRVSNAGVGCRIPAFIVIIPLVALIFTMGGLWGPGGMEGLINACVIPIFISLALVVVLAGVLSTREVKFRAYAEIDKTCQFPGPGNLSL